jgi:hypothetical protein
MIPDAFVRSTRRSFAFSTLAPANISTVKPDLSLALTSAPRSSRSFSPSKVGE